MGRGISSKTINKLQQVKGILNQLIKYQPLTLRQIFYQMVGHGFINNTKSEYVMLSKLLKKGRMDGEVSWDAVEDRTRIYHNLRGWDSPDSFIDQEIRGAFTGYRRDLIQDQEVYLEVWVEKDALAGVFTKVAKPYTIPVVVCRGYDSVSFLHEFAERIDGLDKEIVVLYFGDFDPTGLDIPRAAEDLLMELTDQGVIIKRCALTLNDISTYKLPHMPEAIKSRDPRAANHVRQYGALAVELDALPPNVLEQKIDDAIKNELDMVLYNVQVVHQANDEEKIAKVQRKFLNRLKKKKAKKPKKKKAKHKKRLISKRIKRATNPKRKLINKRIGRPRTFKEYAQGQAKRDAQKAVKGMKGVSEKDFEKLFGKSIQEMFDSMAKKR